MDTAAAVQIEALIMRAMRPSRMEHLDLAKLTVEMRDMLSRLQTERAAMLAALEACRVDIEAVTRDWGSGDMHPKDAALLATIDAAIAQARGGEKVQG